MRTLSVILLASTTALAQEQVPKGPPQGPPPRTLTKLADGHLSANTEPANVENFEVRVVMPGDTLSAIAADSLKDMKLWPQLWEQNSHIVNPHWIYPNDKILIRPVTRITEAAPPPVVEAPPASTTPAIQPSRTRLVASTRPADAPPAQSVINVTPPRNFSQVKDSDLYCSGFIRASAVSADIKVSSVAEADRAVLAGEGSYLYLSRGSRDGVKSGATYQVIRPTRKIDNPKRALTERDLGMHYLEIALLQVMVAQESTAMARVSNICEAIEVGDIVVPYTRAAFPALPARRNFQASLRGSGQGQGTVVMAMSVVLNSSSAFKTASAFSGAGQGPLSSVERGIAGENSVVYIDVGRANAKPGDLFLVFRDTDETLADGRKERRRSTIGELVILKAEDRASTALVTYSTDAIELGDAVERR